MCTLTWKQQQSLEDSWSGRSTEINTNTCDKWQTVNFDDKVIDKSIINLGENLRNVFLKLESQGWNTNQMKTQWLNMIFLLFQIFSIINISSYPRITPTDLEQGMRRKLTQLQDHSYYLHNCFARRLLWANPNMRGLQAIIVSSALVNCKFILGQPLQ
jgi:hypothetical protein